MATLRSAAEQPAPPRSGKRGFAKRALGFAKRAAARLPGARYLWPLSFAVAVVMIVTGAFNSGAMPLPRRIAFWGLLFLWSAIKWQLWFALMVRRPQDWPRAALIGCVLVMLPLPFEIRVILAAIGVNGNVHAGDVWLRSLVISATIFPVMWLVSWRTRPAARPTLAPGAEGLLARTRTAPESLAAILAEDHYCRVRRRDGSDALVHYRFGDALAEVEALDGLRVHRGAWVAADAVTGAARDGRRWLLCLAGDARVPVSATHLAAVRARGWLRR